MIHQSAGAVIHRPCGPPWNPPRMVGNGKVDHDRVVTTQRVLHDTPVEQQKPSRRGCRSAHVDHWGTLSTSSTEARSRSLRDRAVDTESEKPPLALPRHRSSHGSETHMREVQIRCHTNSSWMRKVSRRHSRSQRARRAACFRGCTRKQSAPAPDTNKHYGKCARGLR